MNRSILTILALVLTFTGCSSLSNQDRTTLQSHGVSGDLYDKMQRHEPIDVEDVITLSQKGLTGLFIVHYLEMAHMRYRVSVEDVARMRQAGVSEGVVSYLAAPRAGTRSSSPIQYQQDPVYGSFPGSYLRYSQ